MKGLMWGLIIALAFWLFIAMAYFSAMYIAKIMWKAPRCEFNTRIIP